MAGEIKTRSFLFHEHKRLFIELFYIRYWDLAPAIALSVTGKISKEIELPLYVRFLFVSYAVHDSARNLKQGPAPVSETVECSRFYQALHNALVYILSCHTAAEILKACKRSAAFTLAFYLSDSSAPHTLYGCEAESQVPSGDREIRSGLINIRGQERDPHFSAFAYVFRYLQAVPENRGKKSGHIFSGITAFHVGSAERYYGVAYRMGFVESI